MYLVVGLGNPGRQYEATRHNMGFDVIDRLVEEHGIPQGGVKFNAMYGKGLIGGEQALLMLSLIHILLFRESHPFITDQNGESGDVRRAAMTILFARQ